MKHLLNICNINGAEVEPVDIITFGSPCQDMSVAGKRGGMKHAEQGDEETTRSGLFYEAIRIIEEMRKATNGEYPKYAVWENVPGAFSSNKGRDFHAVLEALCSVCDSTVSIPEPYDAKRTKLVWNKAGEIVGDNYSVAWRTLDAQYWGVPQRRKRIYLVADFTGRRAGEILFKPDSLRGDLQTSDEAGQEVAADAVGGVDGSVGVECIAFQGKAGAEASLCIGENISSSLVSSKEVMCVYSFDSLSSNSMKSSNPFSGCRAVEIAKCVDTTYPDPSKNQGGVAVVQECLGYDMYNQASTGDKTRTLKTPVGGDDLPVVCVLNDQGGSSINVESEEVSPTLRANSHQHEPVIAMASKQFSQNIGIEVANPLLADDYKEPQIIALQANGIDRADTAGCNGCGWRENESYTLNTVDRHAVCFDRATLVAVQKTLSGEDVSGCLKARDYKGCEYLNEKLSKCVIQTAKPPRKYIIRRLTPTECARLQGFPDTWGQLAPYDPADAEFWEDVRKTYAEISGKKYKPVKNIKKWYEKLHTDSAEYKMWGNGIALPNAEYVIRGIAEQGAKTLGSLFDGSGGFPLAGAMNGIKPLWASEVEPYPIAVTISCSRYKTPRPAVPGNYKKRNNMNDFHAHVSQYKRKGPNPGHHDGAAPAPSVDGVVQIQESEK